MPRTVRKGINLWQLGSVCAISLFFPCQSAVATLVIGVYNDDAFYVGSDSCMMQVQSDGPHQLPGVKKIFQFSDTYCVAMTGCAGGLVRETNTGTVSNLSFSTALSVLCSNAFGVKQPIETKIASIISNFNLIYCEYSRKKIVPPMSEPGITLLLFWGYDDSCKALVRSEIIFDGTNNNPLLISLVRGHNPLQVTFELYTNDFGYPISISGETSFMNKLHKTGDIPPPADVDSEKLAKLASKEFYQTVRDIDAHLPIPTDRMVNWMLNIFELHKKHAATFTTDKGWVDEPYVIYKITREKIQKVH